MSASSAPATPGSGPRTSCAARIRRSRSSCWRRRPPGSAPPDATAAGCSASSPGAASTGPPAAGAPARSRRHGRSRTRSTRWAASSPRRGSTATSSRAGRCTSRRRRWSSSGSSPRSRSRRRGRATTSCSTRPPPRARVRVDGALGASFTPHCARVQPAKLARGLARAAERAGAVIYEGTRATRIAPGRVDTPYGIVRAPHVVRATEGYTAGLPGLRRLCCRSPAR